MGYLILEGFMGCGKTTCGRTLARELLIGFMDTDREIERLEGMRIPELFRTKGEAGFRDAESALLERILREKQAGEDVSAGKGSEDFVLALGGGMPVREENRDLLRKIGEVVYLKASAGLLKQRLKHRRGNRPLLSGEDPEGIIDRLMEEREEIYLDLADYIVETDGKEIDDVVNELKLILHHRREKLRKYNREDEERTGRG